jgi:hypothetical protein
MRVGYTLTKEQHRWLKQLALDLNEKGGASAVLRRLLSGHMATQGATPPGGGPS